MFPAGSLSGRYPAGFAGGFVLRRSSGTCTPWDDEHDLNFTISFTATSVTGFKVAGTYATEFNF